VACVPAVASRRRPPPPNKPPARQFFQNGFWSCSVDTCMPKEIDDVGFLERVVTQLPVK
jgi:hypothetical protein